jgi:hypothetical protein
MFGIFFIVALVAVTAFLVTRAGDSTSSSSDVDCGFDIDIDIGGGGD